MIPLHTRIPSIVLFAWPLLTACGSASDTGARDGNEVTADDKPSDDDAHGNKGDDDAGVDDAGADDTSSDDDVSADDDVMADDDLPATVVTGAVGTGMGRPPPVPVTTAGVGTALPAGSIAPPAEGCITASESQSTGACNLQQQCADGYHFSYCSQLADGSWSCQCSDALSSKELVVRTTEAPCEMISELFPTITVPAFEGEPSCVLDVQSSNAQYCETQNRCTQAEAVTDVVDVVLTEYRYSNCYDYGDGQLSCSCSGPDGGKSFFLDTTDIAGACDVGASLCDPGVAVETVGDETCSLDLDAAGADYCQRQETCSQGLAVGDVQASVAETRYATCSSDADGNSTCTCYDSNHSYTFALDLPASETTTCDQALSVCTTGELPSPEGPVSCAVSVQNASTTACSSAIQCTQDATLDDGVTIGLYGTVYANCQPSGDAWVCQCSSGTSVAQLDVPGDDAWSACTDASAQCPDLVDVQVGAPSPVGSAPCGGYAAPPPATTIVAPVASAPATPAPVAAPSGSGVAVPCLR